MDIVAENTENNRVISHFMGCSEIKNYHSDWALLMPVVELICLIRTEGNMSHDFCYPRTFGMMDENKQFMVRFNCHGLCFGNTLLEATYNAVVEFLYYYNQNKHLKWNG